MNPTRRSNFADAVLLRSVNAFVASLRALLRCSEALSYGQRRQKLHAMREKLQIMDREKRAMLNRFDAADPGRYAALDEYVRRHGDPDTQRAFDEMRARREAIAQETDMLSAIRNEAGTDNAIAIAGYRKYVAEHPESHRGFSALGGALRTVKEWDASLDAFREAERLAGGGAVCAPNARLNIGIVLQEKGEVESAIVQYHGILNADARQSDAVPGIAWYYLGNALFEKGDTKEARRAWKRAAALDSTGTLKSHVQERLKAAR